MLPCPSSTYKRRGFTLVPMYSIGRKFITIDKTVLKSLLNYNVIEAENEDIIANAVGNLLMLNNERVMWSQVFDYKKIKKKLGAWRDSENRWYIHMFLSEAFGRKYQTNNSFYSRKQEKEEKASGGST